MKKLLSNRRGFTMVELLVVMTIIAVLVVMMVIAIQSTRRATRDTQRRSNMASLKTGLEAYYASQKAYPWIASGQVQTLQNITGLTLNGTGPTLASFLSGTLADPTTQNARYCYRRNTANTYTLRMMPEGATTANTAPDCTPAAGSTPTDRSEAFDMRQ